MAKKLYGDLEIQTNRKLKLLDAAGGEFVSIRAPATVTPNFELVLPGSDTANGVMKSDGSGNLSLALISNANIDAAAAIAYSKLNLSGSIVNADINASAAIAYSKLNLSGSIVNADVNASAAIAYSKLNLSGSIVNADISASAAIAYSKLSIADGDLTIAKTSGLQSALDGKVADTGDTMTGNLVMDNEKEVRFREATGNGTEYVGFKAPASLAASLTYTLPNAAPAANGYVLASQTDGTLSWTAQSTVAAFDAQWTNANGTSKVVTHSLGSKKVMVQVYDEATDETIEVDSVVRTDANTVTLSASEAPGTNWRVLIIKIT